MSCESSNWESRIHSTNIQIVPLECKDLERVDKPEFIKEEENDYKES